MQIFQHFFRGSHPDDIFLLIGMNPWTKRNQRLLWWINTWWRNSANQQSGIIHPDKSVKDHKMSVDLWENQITERQFTWKNNGTHSSKIAFSLMSVDLKSGRACPHSASATHNAKLLPLLTYSSHERHQLDERISNPLTWETVLPFHNLEHQLITSSP
jgi:hypothetical protein